MARKGNVNKSQAIRDYSAANPDAKPMAIAAALKKRGVNVTPEFVSTVRSNDKRKTGDIGGRQSRGTVGKGAISQVLPSLIEAKKMADLLGGTDKAREALDALDKLS